MRCQSRMGGELTANLYARPMDTEQVRRFANTLLEVEAAGSDATARHRRERASGIIKLWNSSDDRPDRRDAVGGLQRRHRIPRPRRADPRSPHRLRRQRRPCPARHQRRRQHPIDEGPGLPDAANPVAGPAGPPFFRCAATPAGRGHGHQPVAVKSVAPHPFCRSAGWQV